MAFTMGEDDACASFCDNSDAQRRTDAPPTETRLLPGRIANAIVAIYEDLEDCKLNPNHRKVLACLVRCGLKQDAPRDYIFIKKSTISKKTGLHEATIYRCLNALEAAGLIEREPQHKTLLRLQVIGRIRLTQKALVALNIDISRKPAGGEGGGTTNRLAAVRDVNGVNTQSSSKKQPAAPGSFVQVQGKAVPIDLAWLSRENGLAVSGLFLLMRIAREARHRLSDIVATAEAALRPLRGRELFAYLKALIRKPMDYGYLARQREAEVAAKREERELQTVRAARIVALVAQLRGKRVTRSDGTIFEVDAVSVTMTNAVGCRYAAVHAQALPWLEEMSALTSASTPNRSTPDAEFVSKPQPVVDGHLQRLRALVRPRFIAQSYGDTPISAS